MPTEYQRTKNNPYYLPDTLYKRVIAVIRDYNRQRAEIIEVLYSVPDIENSEISKSGTGKPTEKKADRLWYNQNDVEAVVNGLSSIPEEYQEGVFRNIIYNEKFNNTASYRTWIRQKQRFIYEVAKNLHLI